jgi:hypothetical protein
MWQRGKKQKAHSCEITEDLEARHEEADEESERKGSWNDVISADGVNGPSPLMHHPSHSGTSSFNAYPKTASSFFGLSSAASSPHVVASLAASHVSSLAASALSTVVLTRKFSTHKCNVIQ